ncbi:MAG: FAD-binding oxidoreductase, partial [Alphaproteobacteria bacterium]
SYSICSAPGSGTIELAIELLQNGEVSSWFHEVAEPGDTIELRGPIGGHFVWRRADGGPILLIAGGSGVAPAMAIVRHRAAVAPEVPALLAYSARTWEDVIFRDELIRAEAAQANLSVVLATTRGPPHRPQDIGRRLDRASLRDLLGRTPMPRHVYVCGSNAFVESVTGALVDEGLAPEGIRTERFGGEG